jgi:hypothetical protein
MSTIDGPKKIRGHSSGFFSTIFWNFWKIGICVTFGAPWWRQFASKHSCFTLFEYKLLLSISLLNIAALQQFVREIFVVKVAEPLRKWQISRFAHFVALPFGVFVSYRQDFFQDLYKMTLCVENVKKLMISWRKKNWRRGENGTLREIVDFFDIDRKRQVQPKNHHNG